MTPSNWSAKGIMMLAGFWLALPAAAQPWIDSQKHSPVQAEQALKNFMPAPKADATTGGWLAFNPYHGFQISYRPNGQTHLDLAGADQATHHVSLQLQGFGYGNELMGLEHAPTLSANGNTVSYQWQTGLREWWINSPQGVAQWFEFAEPPEMERNDGPLVVAMRLDTDLGAQVRDNVLQLQSADGSTSIRYDRLKVWDSTGRILPAEMVLSGDQLALHVDDQSAVYPVTIDPTLSQEAFLKASNAGASDSFGLSVALDGDTLVVGAPNEASNGTGGESDNSASSAGAVYVFVRNGTGWIQQAYLKASNAEASDSFGSSIALDGDTLVVGAEGEDSSAAGGETDNSAAGAGAAYVFVRTGTTWSLQAYLKAANADSADAFGASVSIDGDTLVVGASREASSVSGDGADNSAPGAGAAYVFLRSGVSWSQQAYIKALIADANDQFGTSVALDNNTLVVGAVGEDSTATGGPGDNSTDDAGAVYVFQRSGVAWTLQAFVKASNAGMSDSFGGAVALRDDTLAVGARFENSSATGGEGDNSADNAGAVYVFSRIVSRWPQQAYLKASNAEAFDTFGESVSLSDDTLVVGARFEDSSVNGGEGDNSAENAGAAYRFRRSGTTWTQQEVLKASNAENTDEFGISVAIDGNTIVVGARNESSSAVGGEGDNSAISAGAAYVFDLFVTIGGTVTNLSGSGLVLQNNGGDDLPIGADGSFTFNSALPVGASYAVSVATQPTSPSQTCAVSNGSGTLTEADVTDVAVNCVIDQFAVTGSVSGLSGMGLILQNNGGDDLTVTADGSINFSPQNDGTAYNITVAAQPAGPDQVCTVSNGSGTISGSNVTDLEVSCVTTQYNLRGNVNGLTGTGLVLQNNGGGDLAVTANGGFSFGPQDDGTAYNVTVAAQPAGPDQVCTVSNGSGIISGGDVIGIEVTCISGQFTVGGTVSGLAGTGLVLRNNGGNNLVVAANGPFSFNPQDDGTAYNVTVALQPRNPNQVCTVTGGSGTLAGGNVSNVLVSCVTDQYTVSGAVSGLAAGNSLTLQNNAGDDLIVSSNGAFAFTPQDDGSSYAITVLTQPTGPDQTCTVSGGNGTISAADVSNVTVDCVTDQFAVSGTVSGLAAGNSLTLQNNAGDDQLVTLNGGFAFSAQDDGSTYAVTVLTQPSDPNQTCVVTGASGVLAGTDVTDVVVSCTDITLSLSTTNLNLGQVPLGAEGDGAVTVSNAGPGNLILNGITSPSAPFSVIGGSCQPLPITLASGESCLIDIRFTPTSIGQFSDQLVISSNAASNPDSITVRASSSLETASIPTLNTWALILLMLIMLGMAGTTLRRVS